MSSLARLYYAGGSHRLRCGYDSGRNAGCTTWGSLPEPGAMFAHVCGTTFRGSLAPGGVGSWSCGVIHHTGGACATTFAVGTVDAVRGLLA